MNRLATLLAEVHQRSIWQIFGSYVVGSWIVLQLAETLSGLIGLPLWFGPTVVALVLMGFPIVLITSLVQGGWTPRTDPPSGADTVRANGDGVITSGGGLRRVMGRVFTWRGVALAAASTVLLLGVGTAGYTGMRLAGIGPVGSLMARGVFTDEERIILAQFEDRTPGGLLGETVTALFRIDLAQSPAIVLLDQAQLRGALDRMQRDPGAPLDADVARELAVREGVKAVVVGEVLPLGEGAVVVTRLVRASGGETLVALREPARRVEEIPDAVDRLSAQLRERIGESLRSIQGNPPLQQVTTASLQALRKYAQAERANDAGVQERAETLLREAVAEDSTFSMAWRKLGVLLQNANREPEQASDAFTRAFAGRERLTERERLLADAAYYTYVTGDDAAATREYERLLETYPTDRIALNNLGNAYAAQGRQRDAVELYVRSIRQGGAPTVTYSNVVPVLFNMGDADSAAVIIGEFRSASPDNPTGLMLAAAFAAARFDYDGSESMLRGLLAPERDPTFRVLAWLELANLALLRGGLSEAKDLLRRALDFQDQAGVRFVPQPRPILEALVLAQGSLVFSENPLRAVAELDRGLAALSPDREAAADLGHTDYAELYALAGRTDRARERLEAYEAEVPEQVRALPEQRAARLGAEAAIARAEGRYEEELRLLLEARDTVVDCPLCFLAPIGEAYERQARPDSAVAVLRRYLDTPVFYRTGSDSSDLHLVLLALGRSYEALQQPAQAAVYYRRFVTLWSDADPELQPRVERVVAKLSELEAGH